MTRNQIIVFGFCAVFGLSVYLFASTKKPHAETDTHAEHPETAPVAEGLDIEEYVAETAATIADDAVRQKVEELTAKQDYKALISEYIKLDKPLAVLYYSVKIAEQKNTADEYSKAGEYAGLLAQTAPDQKALQWLNETRIACLEKAEKLNPSDESKMQLASAYIEGSNNPMQGVTMLREMVARDSTNIDAQLMLAKFGMVSGQFDKAIVRLEKILSLAPRNQDALLLLAQAYENSGETAKAIEVLKTFRSTVKDAATQKQVDDYMEGLKKKINS